MNAPPFVQIAASDNAVFGLDKYGRVWVREAYADGSGGPWVKIDNKGKTVRPEPRGEDRI